MNSDDLLRNQINQVIRSEIQSEINDYVDEQQVVEKAGLGFVSKEDEKELKVRVPAVSYTHLTLPTSDLV